MAGHKNAGCALVLLTRHDAMLLSLACVSFAVVLLFSKRFLLSLKTPLSNASPARRSSSESFVVDYGSHLLYVYMAYVKK